MANMTFTRIWTLTQSRNSAGKNDIYKYGNRHKNINIYIKNDIYNYGH